MDSNKLIAPPYASSPCATTTQSFFARWLARRQWDDGAYELVGSRIVRRIAVGSGCKSVAVRLHRRLVEAAYGTGIVVLDPRQGLELPTGDTLAPDIAIVTPGRWKNASPSAGDLLRVVPDVVVEVMPEWLAHRDRAAIRRSYARAGVGEYWLVDPHACSIVIEVESDGDFVRGCVLAGRAALCSPMLPTLRLGVGALFAQTTA